MVNASRKLKGIVRMGLLLGAGLVPLGGTPAEAAIYGVPVADEDPNAYGINGTRTVADGELEPTRSGYWSDASVSWSIFQTGSAYRYEYTFDGFAGPGRMNQDVSHATFDLTDGAADDGAPVSEVRIDGSLVGPPEYGDFHGIKGAFKIDVEFPGNATTLSFRSSREPVLGNLFLKGGLGDLRNAGFDAIATSNDPAGFIARPNGPASPPNGIIPLPAAVWPGLLLLAGVVLLSRRQRRAA